MTVYKLHVPYFASAFLIRAHVTWSRKRCFLKQPYPQLRHGYCCFHAPPILPAIYRSQYCRGPLCLFSYTPLCFELYYPPDK